MYVGIAVHARITNSRFGQNILDWARLDTIQIGLDKLAGWIGLGRGGLDLEYHQQRLTFSFSFEDDF